MPWAAFAAFVVAGALFLFSKKAEATQMETAKQNTLDDIFRRVGKARGVDPDLLAAIAFVESSLNPQAVRWNPPRDVSAGLMQILCVPPEGADRGEDFVCQNRLNLPDWPSTFNTLLNDTEGNVDIAAQILRENIRQYGYPRGVAVYNNFSARHAGVNGPFPNDAYVGRVLKRLEFLKGNNV